MVVAAARDNYIRPMLCQARLCKAVHLDQEHLSHSLVMINEASRQKPTTKIRLLSDLLEEI